MIKKLIKKAPIINKIIVSRDHYKSELDKASAQLAGLTQENNQQKKILKDNKARLSKLLYEPGHFYSPIPDGDDIRNRSKDLFDRTLIELPGINLRTKAQLELLNTFYKYYDEIIFPSKKTKGLRYHYENDAYSYTDSIMLYSFMRYLKPSKVIEVGSGYSSAAMLDVDEHFLDKKTSFTFIEPYPKLLQSLLKNDDKKRVSIEDKNVQMLDPSYFSSLKAGDILFIDSTHVSKVGSDVNHIFFKIIPSLAKGVYVHIHDVFWPFEYLEDWVYEGRAWNEDYLLRAFLMYNDEFEIVLWSDYMHRASPSFFTHKMPLCKKNLGGSIWLRKTS